MYKEGKRKLRQVALCSPVLLLSFFLFILSPWKVTCFTPHSPSNVNRPYRQLSSHQGEESHYYRVHSSEIDNDSSAHCDNKSSARRQLLVGGTTTLATIITTSSGANAAESFGLMLSEKIQSQQSVLPTGLLESRVTENVLSPPPYGLEASDVYYPSWFSGTWNVESKTDSIEAPCGTALFGGNATYQKALTEVGSSLSYSSRFISIGETCVADREYNVRSIAQAAMGANSVMDIPLATPNKLTAMLAPAGSPSILKCDLITLNRRQENISANEFHCSEVVREIVAPAGGPVGSPSPTRILKEIETASLYTYNPLTDTVTCRQRSAAFLLPSQQSPMALKMWEVARGRPVDVRFYNVLYTRKQR